MSDCYVLVSPVIRVIRGKDQFTYRSTAALVKGQLVMIPWRNSSVLGVVQDNNVTPYPTAKWIETVLPDKLPEPYNNFLHWLADHYEISLSSAYLACLPQFHKKKALKTAPQPVLPRALVIQKKRQAVIQQVVDTVVSLQSSSTILYQRSNEAAAVVLGLIKHVKGPVVIICPDHTQIAYWSGVVAQYHPLVVEAKHKDTIQSAWQVLVNHQPGVLIGTKRLSLLPLTEATRVIVLDPENSAHEQWDMKPRYHVQTVVDKQTYAVYLSMAPRTEQVAHQPIVTALLTEDYLPKITTIASSPGVLFAPGVLAAMAEATHVVLWHNRTVNVIDKTIKQMFPDKTIIVGTTALFNKLDWSTIDTVIATSLDAQLTLPDYRSHETTLQQLIWLRNRVARLYIQTYAPDHPVIQALHQPYPEQWYKQTLRERKRFHYPPYVLI
ncbi:MAG: hypothetical protein WCV88_00165 [Patescibacteria group bacterium]